MDGQSVIENLITTEKTRKAILNFYKYHKIIDGRVLLILYEKDTNPILDHMVKRMTMNREEFLKGLPIFLYEDIARFLLGNLSNSSHWNHYISLVEKLYYDYHIELQDIFSYPQTQIIKKKYTGNYYQIVEDINIWIKYLELIKDHENYENEKFPQNLTIRYHDLLSPQEKKIYYGLDRSNIFNEPIINNTITLSGYIPVDVNGEINMDLLDLYIENPTKIWAEINAKEYGKIHIEVNNNTIIKVKDKYRETDTWITVFRGPNVELWDNKKIQRCRENLKMTQMKFADELDITVDTVANWEHGRSIPNGLICLKIQKLCQMHNVKFDFFEEE